MIAVLLIGNRWGWQFISDAGRVLWESRDRFDREGEAADDAKRVRTGFWAHACQVDHRMAACI